MELLQYSFMIRAIIAGLLVSITAPVLGSFLVIRRYSLMADTLAHVSLVGIALGFLLQTYPFLTALIVTCAAAVIIERIRETRKIFGESVLALFLSGSLATAVLLASASNVQNVNLMNYLFGSITTVTATDVWVIAGVSAVIILTVIALYKELFITSFDGEYAKVSGVPLKLINTIFIILTAAAITLAIRIVGVLLIGALMVIPVIAVMHHTRSFVSTILNAVFVSMVAVISGLILSFYANVPSGATIVLLLIGIFTASFLTKKR